MVLRARPAPRPWRVQETDMRSAPGQSSRALPSLACLQCAARVLLGKSPCRRAVYVATPREARALSIGTMTTARAPTGAPAITGSRPLVLAGYSLPSGARGRAAAHVVARWHEEKAPFPHFLWRGMPRPGCQSHHAEPPIGHICAT